MQYVIVTLLLSNIALSIYIIRKIQKIEFTNRIHIVKSKEEKEKEQEENEIIVFQPWQTYWEMLIETLSHTTATHDS